MDSAAVERAFGKVRARLEAVKAALKAELRDYPKPITACDAQYNHLSDERRRLAGELATLEELCHAAAAPEARLAALQAFAAASSFLDDASEAGFTVSVSR